MKNHNKDKRLVLIGIRRKGEKGFQKLYDDQEKESQGRKVEQSLIAPYQIPLNASKIICLLPE